MKFGFILVAASAMAWGQVAVNSLGIVQTGLPAAQDNLLGPLIPSGNSPWLFGDLAEKAVADNMAPAALAEAPTLGAALPGTGSWTSGFQTITTSTNLTAQLAGKSVVVYTWTTVDGPGTGRLICPIQSVTATTITCSENIFEPSSSGQTGYLMPPADSHGYDFQSWTTENPSTTWNYYDVAIALYRLYYRTGNTTYQNYARQYADITWQWTLDHGYRSTSPRGASMISQFFRALEGHTERLPGLYNWINMEVPRWASAANSPAIDNREAGYTLWDVAMGAKGDTDPTRHAQYCSWLNTYTPIWSAKQSADGSWGENEFALNWSYVSAPESFTAPFVYETSPWRIAITIKGLEAAYESLNDTSSQGCNNPTQATTTLTTISNAVTWQNNYGRDSVNRGVYYEVNSMSDDQDTIVTTAGTVSINVGSKTLTGSGTNWQTAGYCNGTYFIGIQSTTTVYKIASCTSNTAATLTAAFGLYGETSNVSGSGYGIAPPALTSCNSSATYCGVYPGDRNLTRTVCGGMAWLYAQTLNATFKGWADECVSATLGGPASGMTSAANLGSVTMPCAGPGCDGLVTDFVAAAASCYTQPAPCVYGSYLYSNLGKNFGETFGAPGIDNALAWRLTVSPCDLNTDGVVNVLDVQLMVSQAIGTTSCTNRLDGAATCDVIDVQRVVNAALGGACRQGP